MTPFASPSRVLVRPVSLRFVECLRSEAARSGGELDVAKARAQHAGYVATLHTLGLEVEEVPGDDDAPDACFLEDTAVVLGSSVLATRPGAIARQREVAPVAKALGAHGPLVSMTTPATLDGGDVLRVGGRLFVGLSTRTNAEGARALADAGKREGLDVVTLTVRDGLHLKSACTLANASTLLYDARVLGDDELSAFSSAGLRVVEAPEPLGANVLALGASVLVSAGAPRTAALLRAEGFDVRVVDVGQMHLADGALTCLSVRLPQSGAWCT